MANEKKHILIVEDEFLLALNYTTGLENLGFKEVKSMCHYELDDVVVHIASSKADVEDRAKNTPYMAVFLDHNLAKGVTSESILPDIFRQSPTCAVYLASGNLKTQTDAATKVLGDAGLANHVPQMKPHLKSNTTVFERIMNDIIRPAGGSSDPKPGVPSI